jgi:hypothetical protein
LHFNLTEGRPLSPSLAALWPSLPSLPRLLLASHLGRLPLADYYKELIADGSALQTLFKFVGIDPPPPAGG